MLNITELRAGNYTKSLEEQFSQISTEDRFIKAAWKNCLVFKVCSLNVLQPDSINNDKKKIM